MRWLKPTVLRVKALASRRTCVNKTPIDSSNWVSFWRTGDVSISCLSVCGSCTWKRTKIATKEVCWRDMGPWKSSGHYRYNENRQNASTRWNLLFLFRMMAVATINKTSIYQWVPALGLFWPFQGYVRVPDHFSIFVPDTLLLIFYRSETSQSQHLVSSNFSVFTFWRVLRPGKERA